MKNINILPIVLFIAYLGIVFSCGCNNKDVTWMNDKNNIKNQKFIDVFFGFGNKNVELGIREDGIVVWRDADGNRGERRK